MKPLAAWAGLICFVGLILTFHQRIAEVEEQREEAVAAATRMQKVAEGLRDVLLQSEGQRRERFAWTASWYDYDRPRVTASGERFNGHGLTAAHRTLPFGKVLLLRCGARWTVVRVNDRGPESWTGRDIDLSRGAAEALGFVRAGVAKVQVEVLN
jgi:rare lipoprotein A (peptidoglycan hydrolase)